MSADIPVCKCNIPAVLKVSKSEANPNRGFYSCPNANMNDKSQGCTYFCWIDMVGKPKQYTSRGKRQNSPVPSSPQSSSSADISDKLDLIVDMLLAKIEKRLNSSQNSNCNNDEQ